MFGLYLGKLPDTDHIFVLNDVDNTLILVYYFRLSK